MSKLGMTQRRTVVAVWLGDTLARHTAGELSDRTGIPLASVQQILREMAAQGLLKSRKEKHGKTWRKRYWMPPEGEARLRGMLRLEGVQV